MFDSLLSNRETNRNNVELDQETLSGESIRRRDFRDSRSNQGTGEIKSLLISQGEIYGFVDINNEVSLIKLDIFIQKLDVFIQKLDIFHKKAADLIKIQPLYFFIFLL